MWKILVNFTNEEVKINYQAATSNAPTNIATIPSLHTSGRRRSVKGMSIQIKGINQVQKRVNPKKQRVVDIKLSSLRFMTIRRYIAEQNAI